MYLIEILLPTKFDDGSAIPEAHFEEVSSDLLHKYAGITGFFRDPFEGMWRNEVGSTEQDTIAIIEVMASNFDTPWWHKYKEKLLIMFQQKEIIIEASQIQCVN